MNTIQWDDLIELRWAWWTIGTNFINSAAAFQENKWNAANSQHLFVKCADILAAVDCRDAKMSEDR